ncbi:MAG: hypothetical protein JRI55_31810 [Deltaproteobacteria bacterium]|jgi:hypothetical protein|nr:hypothetical protein [Deltaproteobacteria bacterium]
MTAHGGFLYAKSSSNTNASFYRYDPASNAWTSRAAAPCPTSCDSHNARMTASPSHVYYFVLASDLYRYNPTSNSWSSRADLPVTRESSDLVEYAGGYVYHLQFSTRDLRRYDIAQDSWSGILETFPSTTYGYHDLCNVAGLLYAVSGQAGARVYDPVGGGITSEWLAPAEIMAYDESLAQTYVWSGLGGTGSTFQSCDLSGQTSVVLSTPPHPIYSNAFAYIPAS